MHRKKQLKDLEKIQEKTQASEYSQKVESDFKWHDDQVNTLLVKNQKIMENQFNTVIEDRNNDKK
jgi:hypothetical protein